MGHKQDQQVDTFKHDATGTEIKIMLDRNKFEYFAVFQENRFEDKDIDEVRKSIKQAIENCISPQWIDVIMIKIPRCDSLGGRQEVKLSIQRFHVASRGKKMWMIQSPWDTLPEKRAKDSREFQWCDEKGREFILPYMSEFGSYHDPSTGYYPYSAELWDRLRLVKDLLAVLQGNIEKFLHTALIGEFMQLNVDEIIPSLLTSPLPETTTTSINDNDGDNNL